MHTYKQKPSATLYVLFAIMLLAVQCGKPPLQMSYRQGVQTPFSKASAFLRPSGCKYCPESSASPHLALGTLGYHARTA